ncbi:hypothetical protein CLPU_13c00620 [Gottschalkia purinilytica]|uniref:DUF218 domain-containing protein n=1 Tax=Gottschalkia purinilytica TaxID=1503 RepID=A0A0L0W8U1_GOTPU|nr:YdcF family protein [Gottschalkia purinilytica]KNF07720.1 hypothetical protein CLPU_13c00620 [Gottschalkia purinilytica]
MKRRKIYKRLFLGMFIILVIYIIYTAFSVYSFGNKNELRRADAAIVLGAAVWGNKPSPVFKERINHGIWLYKNGYVKKIIFTGGKPNKTELSEALVGKRYAEKKSIPSSDILIEEKSRITQENLIYAKDVAEENNLKSFLIVSDPIHMKRAMIMSNDIGLKAYSSPTPTTKYRSLKSKGEFLIREVYFYTGYLIYRIIK